MFLTSAFRAQSGVSPVSSLMGPAEPWQSLTQRFHSKMEKMFNYIESLGVNVPLAGRPAVLQRLTEILSRDCSKEKQRLMCVWEIMWSNKQRTGVRPDQQL